MFNHYPSLWQIGLDIQCGALRVIALQRRRQGWQLRHWWYYPLPEYGENDDLLFADQEFIAILRQWRSLLPRRFSLRIALPASRVLQHQLAAPPQSLDPPALDWYVKNKSADLLPMANHEVMLDYRRAIEGPQKIYVTVARRAELNRWLDCLATADLYPEVVEIMPCVLRNLACHLAIKQHALLLHFSDHHLLWVSPWQEPLHFGLLPILQKQSLATIQETYFSASGRHSQGIYFSSVKQFTPQLEMKPLTPFSLIQQLQPPLPSRSDGYALAMGLAIRDRDQE